MQGKAVSESLEADNIQTKNFEGKVAHVSVSEGKIYTSSVFPMPFRDVLK
jgi:hypothetical protein